MASMITATANIKKAIGLLNDLDSARFPLLLSRILQKLHLKDDHSFSEDEEEKLQNALSLTSHDLQLVITTSEFFLHQAAYHAAKPAGLGEQLHQLGLEQDKVGAIVDAWTSSGRGIIEKLRQRTVTPLQLEDVNWRLNLQMGQKSQSKMKEPNATFEFKIHNENTQEKEDLRVEFSHEELYAFYDQLEIIQSQIDSIS